MSRNEEVARLLEEFADLLAAKGVEYKPRAYERAAGNIREYPTPIEALADAGGAAAITDIDQVGDAISEKVLEYLETGEIDELSQLREELPVDMATLTSVDGVGPKTVGTLYEELDITTLEELEDAAEAGEIQAVKGFGPKTEQNILENVDFARQAHERTRLGEGRRRGESVREYFEEIAAADAVELAGSIRRWRETVGDVDVLVGSEEPGSIVDAFTDWPEADVVIEAGTSKAAVRSLGTRVDLRVVDPTEFGSALQYFTGSKDHNVALRNIAIDRDLKMNEYGVFDVSDVAEADADQRAGERVAGETEEGMYEALGLPWIPPELRENRGEIDAAHSGELPNLLPAGAMRGDLHLHTDWSDGNNTIAEMVEGAAAYGHEYVAITDHATGPGMVGGVGVEDDELRRQIDAVGSVAEDAKIGVFTGVEANIDADGGLSVADDLLSDLDVVVAAPHSGLSGDGTDRLQRAATHPSVDILGHPTGRYINQRAGLDIDVAALAETSAAHGTALEINANPKRLDLGDRDVRTAIEAGATIAIDTDAHRPANYDFMRFGVHTARRGWAEIDDILNARSVPELRDFLA